MAPWGISIIDASIGLVDTPYGKSGFTMCFSTSQKAVLVAAYLKAKRSDEELELNMTEVAPDMYDQLFEVAKDSNITLITQIWDNYHLNKKFNFAKGSPTAEKSSSNVSVSGYVGSLEEGVRFRVAYGLGDVSGNLKLPIYKAKACPFEVSFLAQYTADESEMDCDTDSYGSFKVITLKEDFFKYFWTMIGLNKIPCIDIRRQHEGLKIHDYNLKELAMLNEPRPVNVVYVNEDADGGTVSNVGFNPCLNGNSDSVYNYVRATKFSTRRC